MIERKYIPIVVLQVKFVVQKKVGIRRKKPGGNSAEDETVQRGYYFSQ
jgi:hypothetical protein